MHSRPTPAPSTAVSLTATAFAIGTALCIWSRSGLKGNAILLAGVVALVVAFPVNWFFPRWRAPLAATGAVFLCGYVASPVARALLDTIPVESPLRYWLVSGPGNGILGQLPSALLLLLVGRYIFGLSLRDLWSGTLGFTRGSWLYGTLAAIFITVVTVGLAAAVGQGQIFWHFVPAEFGVNLFSNLWTAIVFGLMHGFEPKGYFLIVITWVLAWAVVRGRTLWAGWFAHQLADLFVDSLLH